MIDQEHGELVFEVATGEVISFEDVGGVDVHARHTGQIDLGVDTDEEAYAEAIKPDAQAPARIIVPARPTMGDRPGSASLRKSH